MPTDEFDPSGPVWPTNNGIDILGTPYDSPVFVEEYLHRKLAKHARLLDFISVVAKMGYSREAHKMLIGFAVHRLIHIVKSMPKDDGSIGWMTTVDEAHFIDMSGLLWSVQALRILEHTGTRPSIGIFGLTPSSRRNRDAIPYKGS